jgi:hypothetical protein
MARFKNTLDHVRVAAPCKSDWDQMIGSERVRFCGQCSLNVYNLSSMTRADAESLIARTEGRLCVRFYRRSDGSIMTKDCPVGLRAIRRRVSNIARAISSMLLGLFAGLGVHGAFSNIVMLAPQRTMGTIAFRVNPDPQIMPRVEEGLVEVKGEMFGKPPRRRNAARKTSPGAKR